jgi:NAD(P)-dependent dehydrogenase (short-subunit alcohol dehydrogenase family)
MTLLPDRVVLISGGTRGLGVGIARAAAREGAMVAVTGRQRESARLFLMQALTSSPPLQEGISAR